MKMPRRNNLASFLQWPLRIGCPFLPAKYLIAIDPGNRSLKVLLVESSFPRLRILRQELIELPEDGAGSLEELHRQLQTTLQELGPHPIALALPPHRAMSQIIDLPPAGAGDVEKLITEETHKLSGLSESAIVYDYQRLPPFTKHLNPYWVTLCQEREVVRQIDRLHLESDDVCEVAASANSLIAAYLALQPAPDPALLVDMGSGSTGAAIVVGGHGVYAGSFAIGGNVLTDAIAARRNCPFETAEQLKRTENLFTGDAALPELWPVVRSWSNEIERILTEWLADHRELALDSNAFQIILSGGGALQPGLLDFLRQNSKLRYTSWTETVPPGSDLPDGRFAVAYGTALQGLGASRQPSSLLPPALRQVWKKQRGLHRVYSINLILLLVIGLVLAFGTWQQISLAHFKKNLLGQARSAWQQLETAQRLESELSGQYEEVRPVLEHQQRTLDTLQALALLQQVRSNRSYWYVAFADQQSYASAPDWNTQTNQPFAPLLSVTNPPAPLRAYVAEMCVPEAGETMRRTVGEVVDQLGQSAFLGRVDILPADRTRDLVDPKVFVPGHKFSLILQRANPESLPASPAPKAPVRASAATQAARKIFKQRSYSVAHPAAESSD